MATTKIHAIHVSPNRCINYAMKNKVGVKRDGIDGKISYEQNNKNGDVQYQTLSSYLNCHEGNVSKTFHKYADKFRGKFRNEAPRTKNGKEVVAWHLIQNFDKHEISPQAANEIGLKLAKEMFGNFPVVISTHTDTENIHNHIVICAWNDEGRKWNNDNTNYRKIREASDKLCDEYKISVLEETRKVNLVSYVDHEGKKRFYEPTERKNKIIQERSESGGAKNIDDYRRTIVHQNKVTKKEFDKEVIKGDIDKLIPVSFDYNDLLARLRREGYKIRAKNKGGGWLKYVSFTPPNETRATRDNKLGDGTFYTREGLEKYFDDAHFEASTKESNRMSLDEKTAAQAEHVNPKESRQAAENDVKKQALNIKGEPNTKIEVPPRIDRGR